MTLAILCMGVPRHGIAQPAVGYAQLLGEANITLNHLRGDPHAATLLGGARALYIVPRLVKGGAGFGGDGVLLLHQGDGWAAPKFYGLGSFRSLGGPEPAELVFFLNSPAALRAFEQGNVALTGLTGSSGGDIVVWTSGTVVYDIAGLNGTVVRPDKELNMAPQPIKEAAALLANLSNFKPAIAPHPTPPILAPADANHYHHLPPPVSLPAKVASPPPTETTALPPAETSPSPPPAETAASPPPPQLDVKYNAPGAIPLGAATDYRLIIASSRAVDVADFKGAPGPVEGHKISQVNQVRAVMSGPKDFVDISSGSVACQTVSASDNPSWDWSVTPKTVQAFNLQVEIWDVGPDCNSAAPIVHRIDNFTITVTASWWQTLLDRLTRLDPGLKILFELITAAGGALAAWKWLLPALRGKSA